MDRLMRTRCAHPWEGGAGLVRGCREPREASQGGNGAGSVTRNESRGGEGKRSQESFSAARSLRGHGTFFQHMGA